MNLAKRVLIVVVRIITVGYVNLDPNAPVDYTKDKRTLTEAVTDYLTALKSVRDEKKKLEGELAALEAGVAGESVAAADGKPAEKVDKREALFDIKLKRKEVGLLKAREGVLCGKIERAKILLGLIELHNDSQKLEVSDHVRDISKRVQVQIDDIAVSLDEAKVDAEGMSEIVTISDHDDELDRIEEEILERGRKRERAKVEKTEPASRTAEIRKAINKAEGAEAPGYEVVNEDDDDDREPPTAEPPQTERKLDFS